MEKRIIFNNPDGSISVMIPAPKARGQILVKEAVYETVTFEVEGETQEHQALVSPAQYREETDDEFALRTALQDVPVIDGKQLDFQIIDADQIPEDRYFRAAWRNNGGKIGVCMDTARKIHMDKIRQARSDKFIALGVPYRLNEKLEKAVLSTDLQKELKRLRDIPQTFNLEGAATPEELKGIWPTI